MLESLSLPGAARAELLRATDRYAANVYEAADFLSGRGIGEHTAQAFRLGVVSEPAVPEHERFRGMLSIPYLTPGGVVAIKFRQLDPTRSPKYDSPAGQTARLYNVAALHTTGDTVAVCEGEMDALVMTEVVGIPAVGIPGASHWQPWWARAFADYARVIVVADHDLTKDSGKEPPGQRHANRVVKELGSCARLVMPPAGLDLNDWVLEHGARAVKEACGG